MSALVFAGSSQFIAATLIGSAAAMPVVLLTVFIVNLRHMLYSASLMPYVTNLPQGLRAVMSFWLTDETFATVSTRLHAKTDDRQLSWYYIGSAVAMYGNWQICTMLGIFLQQKIPDMTGWGLDIAHGGGICRNSGSLASSRIALGMCGCGYYFRIADTWLA